MDLHCKPGFQCVSLIIFDDNQRWFNLTPLMYLGGSYHNHDGA